MHRFLCKGSYITIGEGISKMAAKMNGTREGGRFGEEKDKNQRTKTFLSFSIDEILGDKTFVKNRTTQQNKELQKQEINLQEKSDTTTEVHPEMFHACQDSSTSSSNFQWIRCTRYNPPKVQSK